MSRRYWSLLGILVILVSLWFGCTSPVEAPAVKPNNESAHRAFKVRMDTTSILGRGFKISYFVSDLDWKNYNATEWEVAENSYKHFGDSLGYRFPKLGEYHVRVRLTDKKGHTMDSLFIPVQISLEGVAIKVDSLSRSKRQFYLVYAGHSAAEFKPDGLKVHWHVDDDSTEYLADTLNRVFYTGSHNIWAGLYHDSSMLAACQLAIMSDPKAFQLSVMEKSYRSYHLHLDIDTIQNPTYVWFYDDSASITTTVPDVDIEFPHSGMNKVSVYVYANQHDLVSSITKELSIARKTLDGFDLSQYHSIYILFTGHCEYSGSTWSNNPTGNTLGWGGEITVSKDTFSMRVHQSTSYTDTNGQYKSSTSSSSSCIIKGVLNLDNSEIDTLIVHKAQSNAQETSGPGNPGGDSWGDSDNGESGINASHIQVLNVTPDSAIFKVAGSLLKKTSSVFQTESNESHPASRYAHAELKDVLWDDPNLIPSLTIVFKK